MLHSGELGGGTTVPAGEQVTSPQGETPVGGPNTPTVPPPPAPTPAGGAPAPAPQSANQGMQAGMEAQGPQWDEETKALGKAIILKMLKGL